MNKNFAKVEQAIKTKFKNKDLLKQAFVHRSYLNEHRDFAMDHNERMEFLGDAVMELIVTEYLYNKYNNPEGELTNWRSSLVRGETISKVARKLGFNDYLYLSRGEAKAEGRARDLILADNFEAVVGAIYLDQGYAACKSFLNRELIVFLKEIIAQKTYVDPKSKFQEMSQEKFGITPEYKVVEESGPDHDKVFIVGAFLEDEEIAQGNGPSKQKAQEQAADNALDKKGW